MRGKKVQYSKVPPVYHLDVGILGRYGNDIIFVADRLGCYGLQFAVVNHVVAVDHYFFEFGHDGGRLVFDKTFGFCPQGVELFVGFGNDAEILFRKLIVICGAYLFDIHAQPAFADGDGHHIAAVRNVEIVFAFQEGEFSVGGAHQARFVGFYAVVRFEYLE